MENNSFNFIVPAEITKSEDGDWKIRGLASTETVDQQGETIIQKGIDLSPIDQRRGIINFDHQKGPENTIGLLDGYKQSDNGLFIEGRLFKNHSRAKAVREIMSSLGKSDRGRVGLSVEGQVLERDPKNPKVIKKCRINAVAVTLNPVNQSTYADLVKSMSGANIEFNSTEETQTQHDEQPIFTAKQVVEIVEKALAVSGSNGQTAPADRSGGDALSQESMDKKKKKMDKGDGRCWEGYEPTPGKKPYEKGSCQKKKMKKMSKSLYKSNMMVMLEKLQELYPNNTRSELWEAVKDRLNTVYPDVNEEYGN